MQKYKNSAENSKANTTNGYLLVKFNASALNTMHQLGINTSDAKHVELFESYLNMVGMRIPVTTIYDKLAEIYNISISTVKRIIQRFKKEIQV